MLRVKFISRQPASGWERYFSDSRHVWKSCEFVFDRDARQYDWLVVYDELPDSHGNLSSNAVEDLACPPSNTVLITTEPSSIKSYGKHYAAQFGHVLTTQPAWALPHPRRHWQQAANHWFYGDNRTAPMTRDRLLQGSKEKKKDASIVGSNKTQRHTLHAARFTFIQRLQELMPELDVYGRSYIAMDDKAAALDDYRYHIAVENHVAMHHWTEKLSDAFLGRCLPFYVGAPNVSDYFPEGSVIPLDIKSPETAAALIRQAITENWYEQRLPLIEEARHRVIEEYHLFAVIERLVAEADKAVPTLQPAAILSRHTLRKRSLFIAVYHVMEKIRARLRTWRERNCAVSSSS
jgi:hypothetical protein